MNTLHTPAHSASVSQPAISSAHGFCHTFVAGRDSGAATAAPALLMLHGTGGNESDLLPLGRAIAPHSALLSPRGKVLEHGMPRFFRRLAEGVFDEEDLIRRTHELADFIRDASAAYGLNPRHLYAVGYSNGANIAASLLLLRPEVLAGAVLIRAMVPLIPDTLPNLAHKPVLLASGHHDPIVPAENTRRLAAMLKEAGADVTLRLENAGHNMTSYTVETARHWIAERGAAAATAR